MQIICRNLRGDKFDSRSGIGESVSMIRHGWELHGCRSRTCAKQPGLSLEEILAAMAEQGRA
jgi:hypothetical protein